MNGSDAPNAGGFRIRAVPAGRPLHWLALGWSDLMRCPLPGLLHEWRRPLSAPCCWGRA